MKKNNVIYLLLMLCVLSVLSVVALSPEARNKGFVYLSEVDPTIQESVRYCSNENFIGKVVDGYAKPLIILTNQAAQALKKVQEAVSRDGYELVVYDAYRPERAVNHFMRWSQEVANQKKVSILSTR